MLQDVFWALYWIDVLSGIDEAVFLGALLAAVGVLLYTIFHDHDEEAPLPATIRRGIFRVGLPILLFMLVINMVPNKDTMYMMLATRGTDQFLDSSTGKKMSELVNKTIDKYLKQLEQ